MRPHQTCRSIGLDADHRARSSGPFSAWPEASWILVEDEVDRAFYVTQAVETREEIPFNGTWLLQQADDGIGVVSVAEAVIRLISAHAPASDRVGP